MGEVDASYPCSHEWWLSFLMTSHKREKTKKKGEIAHPHRTQQSTSSSKPNPRVTKNEATTRVDTIYIITNKIV
jgi:hypothetical protein